MIIKCYVYVLFFTVRTPQECVGEKPPERILLVDDLHKKYISLCKTTPTHVLRGVSFSVKGGESIGLLGPSGSGKTCALAMIAGRQSITRGDCCVDGWFLGMQRSEYISKVSLIKCHGGLDEFYTGYENLKTLCLLRGYNESQADTFTVNCMAYMGLEHRTHTSVRLYSSGCARQLRLCVALLTASPAVLLDEPMRSVDPHSRPLVARALARLKREGSAVVVAEQSLNWRDIDTLFSRIAVFTNGQISAIGSSSHIREMLADGHTARLKLKLKPIGTSTSVDSILDLVSDEDETAKKALNKKRKLVIPATRVLFNNPESEFNSDNDNIDDVKSDGINKHGESSSSRADTSKKISHQAARDERRHYLTSRQTSENTETEEADHIEEIKKTYRKSKHNLVRSQPGDEEEDSDDVANLDSSQSKTSTGVSQQQQPTTSLQDSESTKTEEDNDTEDIEKSYQKSRHDSIRSQRDDNKEDNTEIANPDSSQTETSTGGSQQQQPTTSRQGPESTETEKEDDTEDIKKSYQKSTNVANPDSSQTETSTGDSQQQQPTTSRQGPESTETEKDDNTEDIKKSYQKSTDVANPDSSQTEISTGDSQQQQPTTSRLGQGPESTETEKDDGTEDIKKSYHKSTDVANPDSSQTETSTGNSQQQQLTTSRQGSESIETEEDDGTENIKKSQKSTDVANLDSSQTETSTEDSQQQQPKTPRQGSESTETEEDDGTENIKKSQKSADVTNLDSSQNETSTGDSQQQQPKTSRQGSESIETEEDDGTQDIKKSKKSTDVANPDSSQTEISTGNSQQQQLTTSRQGSESTDTEEDDGIEDIKKNYQKSTDVANPDRAQSTSDEIKISAPANVSIESVDVISNKVEMAQADSTQGDIAKSDGKLSTTDQTKTSKSETAQLQKLESKINQLVTSPAVIAENIQGKKDQVSALEDQQTIDQIKMNKDAKLAEAVILGDDSNMRFLRDNSVKGTVYADLARETMKRNVISLSSVQALKTDFKKEFPTSKLADEHLSMLHFQIRGDNTMTYSSMFSKLEKLKKKYENIIEDYTLSEISIDDVYSILAKDALD